MLRVVADANVLVSAALARSPQAPSVLTLDAALDGRIELVTSPLLLKEIALDSLGAEDLVEGCAELASRSWIRKRIGRSRAQLSIMKLRAC
jgi:hypothetical protein